MNDPNKYENCAWCGYELAFEWRDYFEANLMLEKQEDKLHAFCCEACRSMYYREHPERVSVKKENE